MSRIVTVTGLWLDDSKLRANFYTGTNTPRSFLKGKYFYIWNDNKHGILEKYRFLGYCVNKFAFKVATIKHDNWSEQ